MQVGSEQGEFFGRHRTRGAPQHISFMIGEQDDDLVAAGNPELPAEADLIDVKRHDPGPELWVRIVVAHGGIVPPAIERVFAARYGQQVVIEGGVKMVQRPCPGHPAVDCRCLTGVKGEQEQVERTVEGSREGHFCLLKIVGSDGWEPDLVAAELRGHERRQCRKKKTAEDDFELSQSRPKLRPVYGSRRFLMSVPAETPVVVQVF